MTQERERILQKIKRVQALAERGIAGEQESAVAGKLCATNVAKSATGQSRSPVQTMTNGSGRKRRDKRCR